MTFHPYGVPGGWAHFCRDGVWLGKGALSEDLASLPASLRICGLTFERFLHNWVVVVFTFLHTFTKMGAGRPRPN